MILQDSVWESWLVDIINAGYIRGLHLAVWIVAIGTMYFVAMLFLKRSLTEGLIISQIWIYRSFALFFMLMGITRILFVFGYFVESYYNFLLATGYAFGAVSLLPIVFVMEKWLITKSKRIFSIFGIILTALSFYFVIFNVSESELSRTIQTIGMPFMAGAFFILYLWMIKISVGSVRKKASMTLFGMIIFVAGILLDGEDLLYTFYGTPLLQPMLYVSPIVFILGMVLIAVAQKTD